MRSHQQQWDRLVSTFGRVSALCALSWGGSMRPWEVSRWWKAALWQVLTSTLLRTRLRQQGPNFFTAVTLVNCSGSILGGEEIVKVPFPVGRSPKSNLVISFKYWVIHLGCVAEYWTAWFFFSFCSATWHHDICLCALYLYWEPTVRNSQEWCTVMFSGGSFIARSISLTARIPHVK